MQNKQNNTCFKRLVRCFIMLLLNEFWCFSSIPNLKETFQHVHEKKWNMNKVL